MEWFIGPTNLLEKANYSYFSQYLKKPALMHTVYEGISQEEMLFNSGGNGMLVQHCLSSLGFALFAYPYTATIYAGSTTF
jgi:hypothetical protein